MPIKGLTQDVEIGLGLPLIARIHKGAPKDEKTRPDGSKYEVVGKDLDHFRAEFLPQFADLASVFDELYGEQPTEFENVLLAHSTVDKAFDTWMEEWTATTLMHRCDGEHQVLWYDTRTQEMAKSKVACVSKEDKPCKCTRIGRLNMILPDFTDATGALGYFQVTTHSIHDIITVYQYLARIEQTCGKLSGIPFTFGRAEKEVRAPKTTKKAGKLVKDGRMKVNKSLFYIHADTEYVQDVVLPLLKSAPALPALPAPKADSVASAKKLGSGAPETRRLDFKRVDEDGVIETITEAEIIDAEVVPVIPPQSNEKAENTSAAVETGTTPAQDEKPANSPSDAKIEGEQSSPFMKPFGQDWESDFQNLMKHASLTTTIGSYEKRAAALHAIHAGGYLKGAKTLSEAVKIVIARPDQKAEKETEKA